MTIPPPKDKLPVSNSQPAGSPPAEVAPGNPPSAKARGLADFVEGLVSGSRLKRSGLPTKPELPEPAQQAQAEEEPPELLDLLLQGPDAVVVLHREQGEVIEVSERFIEWTGFNREQLDGKLFLDFFHEPERKIARTLYEDAGAGGVHVLELPCALPGTRPRLVEFTSAQSQAGNGMFAILVGRDVGERAATERYLRMERDRLNLFIRAMRDSLVLLSPGGDILYANSAAEQTFEPYELPVVCHRWMTEFSHQDKSDLQGLTSAYEGQTMEIDNGDARIFLVTRSFLFESGRKSTVMFMAKDISDQKLIEKQNHQLELELMRESKLAEFGTFSAGIAHNLNGPLTGILGFCELLQLTRSDVKEIEHIRSQGIVMKDIIANLLKKSRNEQDAEPQDLSVEDIISTELQFLDANLFFKHHVQRVVELDPDSPTIHGIYIDLSQVIGNLLRNAIDAMFHSDEKTLTVKTRHDERYLYVTVADTGSGMSDEVKQKIFKPFFTTKPKAADAKPGEPVGTGLGLASSRNILARYGAEISVESILGQGTTFTILFPLHRTPQL
jgi:PAS domain S-box-containing protein